MRLLRGFLNHLYYTRQASVVLAIGGAGRLDALLSNQCCKMNRLLEENVHNLTLQWDTYLQEVQNTYVSLTGIGDSLDAFNLLSSLVAKVKLLVKEVAKKDKALASSQLTISTMKACLLIVSEDLEIYALRMSL